MPVTNFAKTVSRDIERTAEEAASRMVEVLESKDNTVLVQYAEGHEAWYPSAFSGIPAGMWGFVDTTRGKDGFFIPVGVPYIDPGQYVDNTELTAILTLYATDGEVASLLAGYYTKTQIDAMLGPFATEAEVAAGYYSKTQADNLLALKANKPVRNRNKGSGDQVISAAGDYGFKSGASFNCDVALSGLAQSAVYSVHVDVFMRIAGGSSTSGQIGFQLIGASTVTETNGTNITWAASVNPMMWSYEQEVTSTSGGAITVRPITRWGVGSFTPVYCTCAARAERV